MGRDQRAAGASITEPAAAEATPRKEIDRLLLYPPVWDPDQPNDVLPRWISAMRSGDFEEAWRQTDRIELPRRERRLPRGECHLIWNGTPWAGKTVLIRCWHGLGDTVQFIRYLPRLRETASRIILQAQPLLLTLLLHLDGADEVLNGWTDEPDPAHDVEIECMELPYAFRDTLATLPRSVPYLPVHQYAARLPRLCLPQSCKRRVGLVWAASSWNSTRSLPLHLLAPLAERGDVTFYSFQQGQEAREIEETLFPLVPLSGQVADVADTAAGMLAMDLMICVDTLAAHLAGALGRPTWLLLKHDADWRWMCERDDSPWYPTMRLFRQPEPGDWTSPVRQMAGMLAQWMSGSRSAIDADAQVR